jgi:hypothetical protein
MQISVAVIGTWSKAVEKESDGDAFHFVTNLQTLINRTCEMPKWLNQPGQR